MSEQREAPLALVTLRAYRPAPAHIDLVYQPATGRLLRTLARLLVCWAPIPLLLWVPPVYPWVALAFGAGIYLAHRAWTGRYLVHSFAGICPRCGHALSLGVDHAIDLPHTLTCFHCHFEPQLEVDFSAPAVTRSTAPSHCEPHCTGLWELRWLADEPFVVCNQCHAGCRATEAARRVADEENERALLLTRLTREGRSIL
jgi:hypothetical protein